MGSCTEVTKVHRKWLGSYKETFPLPRIRLSHESASWDYTSSPGLSLMTKLMNLNPTLCNGGEQQIQLADNEMVQLPSWNESYPWIWRCLKRVKRTFHILDDARLNVDDDVIDVGNGDISAVIVVPPKAHFLPIPDPAPSSPDPCSNTQFRG